MYEEKFHYLKDKSDIKSKIEKKTNKGIIYVEEEEHIYDKEG